MSGYLSIEKIMYGSFYQREINQKYVNELVEQTKANGSSPKWPPIQVTTKFVLIDGQHRLEAAKKLGLTSIEIDYIDTQEPFIESIKANLTNGQRFTSEERAKIVYILTDEKRKSTREIGQILQCGHATIARILQKRNEGTNNQLSEENSDEQQTRKLMRGFIKSSLMLHQHIFQNGDSTEDENAEWFMSKFKDELKKLYQKDAELLFDPKIICSHVLDVYEGIEVRDS